MSDKPPVLHYAVRGAPPEGPRISAFAVVGLIVSVVSCPCLIASMIDWIDAWLVRAGFAANGVAHGENVAIIVLTAVASVVMCAMAWRRISHRRAELRGETLAAMGLCLGFLWLLLALGTLVFWLFL